MLENIYILLFVCLVVWHFAHMRKIAEQARKHAYQYCKKEGLQFIAIARLKSRLTFTKRHGISWLSDFVFEFSGDGTSKYQGNITLQGMQLENMVLPVYKI